MLDYRIKYPKTPHVPWSVGTSDDKTLITDAHFEKERVIVSLKMDGENTSIYNDYMHARSLYPPNHPSQSWVKKLAGEIGWKLNMFERVCGENLYAQHTVHYDDLPSYFMVFSVWDNSAGLDLCLHWDETVTIVNDLKLITVPIIYDGIYNKEAIIKAYAPYADKHEGYVIRNAKMFLYENFDKNVAKFVNPGFRQTLKESTVHWASAKVIPNKLCSI